MSTEPAAAHPAAHPGARPGAPARAEDRALLERAATVLAGHPWVGEVWIDAGRVWAAPAPAAVAVTPAPGPLLEEFLDTWIDVYDWVYEQAEGRYSEELDLSGWRASDTGQPFPREHMTEWVDRTVELVLGTRPRVVLELGCGSGLLVHRIHPHVTAYLGTDVSGAALERVAAAGLPGVAVCRASAHEVDSPAVRQALARLAGDGVRPDCVLLNSVTQHFPDARYLAEVIRGAVGLVAPGGSVVVGDVRHVGLLEHYCRWREAAADPQPPPDQLARRAAARAAQEEEFLADPRLLAAIAADLGRPVSLAVHAKTMRESTELTRYRFDAVLRVDPAPPLAAARLSWADLPAADRLGALRARAADGAPLRVEEIPNQLLGTDPSGVSGHDLRQALAGLDAAVGVDLTDPTQLVVGVPARAAELPAAASPAGDAPLAHEPLARFLRRRLPEVLRDHLRRTDPVLTRVEVGTA